MLKDLYALKMAMGPLLVNRVLFAEDAKKCRRCQRARQWQLATLARLRRRHQKIYVARNFCGEIAGVRALGRFTAELWQVA